MDWTRAAAGVADVRVRGVSVDKKIKGAFAPSGIRTSDLAVRCVRTALLATRTSALSCKIMLHDKYISNMFVLQVAGKRPERGGGLAGNCTGARGKVGVCT